MPHRPACHHVVSLTTLLLLVTTAFLTMLLVSTTVGHEIIGITANPLLGPRVPSSLASKSQPHANKGESGVVSKTVTHFLLAESLPSATPDYTLAFDITSDSQEHSATWMPRRSRKRAKQMSHHSALLNYRNHTIYRTFFTKRPRLAPAQGNRQRNSDNTETQASVHAPRKNHTHPAFTTRFMANRSDHGRTITTRPGRYRSQRNKGKGGKISTSDDSGSSNPRGSGNTVEGRYNLRAPTRFSFPSEHTSMLESLFNISFPSSLFHVHNNSSKNTSFTDVMTKQEERFSPVLEDDQPDMPYHDDRTATSPRGIHMGSPPELDLSRIEFLPRDAWYPSLRRRRPISYLPTHQPAMESDIVTAPPTGSAVIDMVVTAGVGLLPDKQLRPKYIEKESSSESADHISYLHSSNQPMSAGVTELIRFHGGENEIDRKGEEDATSKFNILDGAPVVASTFFPQKVNDGVITFHKNAAESPDEPTVQDKLGTSVMLGTMGSFKLTTEKLAYILIGSCCALSIVCLVIVALSIRCRKMFLSRKAFKCTDKCLWPPAAKAVRWQHLEPRDRQRYFYGMKRNTLPSGSPGAHSSYNGSCENCQCCQCCSWMLGASNLNGMWYGNSYPGRPRKLPFGAASSLRFVPPRTRGSVMPSEGSHRQAISEDDSLENTSPADRRSSSGRTSAKEQCTCVDPGQQVQSTSTPSETWVHGSLQRRSRQDVDIQEPVSSQSWLNSSTLVDHLHRTHNHCVGSNSKIAWGQNCRGVIASRGRQGNHKSARRGEQKHSPPVSGSNYLGNNSEVLFWSSNDERLI